MNEPNEKNIIESPVDNTNNGKLDTSSVINPEFTAIPKIEKIETIIPIPEAKRGRGRPSKKNAENIQTGQATTQPIAAEFDIKFSDAIARTLFNLASAFTGLKSFRLEDSELQAFSEPLNIVVNKYLPSTKYGTELLLIVGISGVIASKIPVVVEEKELRRKKLKAEKDKEKNE